MLAIDFDAYLAYKGFGITNSGGGRGWDRGVRSFNCPLCGDEKCRGWVNVNWRTAGCFNNGCVAEPRIFGGLAAWVQKLEGLGGISETLLWLRDNFKGGSFIPQFTPKQIERYDDWVRLPEGLRYFGHDRRSQHYQRLYAAFAKRKWGFSVPQLLGLGWGFVTDGFHRGRIFIPVKMGGKVVSFQTRAIQLHAEPKYRNARKGDSRDDANAECGRAGEAILYGIDRLRRGETAVLVEGAADVEAFNMNPDSLGSAVGILGVALTSEKIALLASKQPGKVVIGLDADAEVKSWQFVETLLAWGLDVQLGKWVGAKDAGEGAKLQREDLDIGRRIGGSFYGN